MPAKRRAPGDGTLFKRSDGVWIGAIEVPTTDGKRRRKTVSSKDRNTVIRKLRELKAQIAAGMVPTSPSTTVARWLDHWLENIHAATVRPTTHRHYDQSIRLHINPHIGGIRLDKLTPEDVRAMHRAVQKQSTRAAQKAHQTLQRALEDARRNGLVVRNVAEAVAKPKHTQEQRQAFSVEAAKHILATAIASCDVSASSRWLAAFLTGARQAELLGLTWDRVDLVDGYFHISWQLQYMPQVHGCGGTCGHSRPGWCPDREWKVPPGFEMVPCHLSLCWTRPKSRAGTRLVPLAAPLLAALCDLSVMDTPNPHNLVWHHSDGRPLSAKDDLTAWKGLLKLARLPDCPLHAARHTTASLLQAAGVDEQTRMLLMGQSSVAAHRGYIHVDHTQTRLAVAQLNTLMPVTKS